MDKKEEYLELVQGILVSCQELEKFLDEEKEGVELINTFNKHYPFNKSFDEFVMSLHDWINETYFGIHNI